MLLYRFSGEERPTPGLPDNDTTDWFLGVYRPAVAASLATQQATNALAVQLAQSIADAYQDERPRPFLVDDQYWQNPVAPQLWSTPAVQAFTSDEVAPGAVVVTPVNDDYWINGVAPQLWFVPMSALQMGLAFNGDDGNNPRTFRAAWAASSNIMIQPMSA